MRSTDMFLATLAVASLWATAALAAPPQFSPDLAEGRTFHPGLDARGGDIRPMTATLIEGEPAALAAVAPLADGIFAVDANTVVVLNRDPADRATLVAMPGVRVVEAPWVAAPDVRAPAPASLQHVAGQTALTPGALPYYFANGPDVYRENGQWPLYAIGAARPVPDPETFSGWTPEWRLDVDGQGTTVAIADTGIPSEECGAVVVGFLDAQGAVVGAYLADVWALLYAYGLVDIDLDSGFWRPLRLHPDFEWYAPGDGGFVPRFESYFEYDLYRRNELNAWRVEDTIDWALEDGAPLLDAWGLTYLGYAIEGELCDTADPRLPDPDALTWVASPAVDYLEPPFDDPALVPQVIWRGYDATGDLRLVFDPFTGGMDRAGHGTAVSGPLAARHRPGQVWGAMRGLAPHAKYLTYNFHVHGRAGRTVDLIRLLLGWKMAPEDGAQVVSNSFWNVTSGHEPPHRESGGAAYFEHVARAGSEAAGAGVLMIMLTNNEATDLDALRSDGTYLEAGDLRTLTELLSNGSSLLVAGTAPRDYAWYLDVAAWMPDAPGKPDDRTRNLDRPMIFQWNSATPPSGTGYGRAVDLAAPSGSFPSGLHCADDDVPCIASGYGNMFYSTTRRSAFPNTGPHDYSLGTSYAVPMVAGAAALTIQAHSEAHGDAPRGTDLRSLLLRSADDRAGPLTDLVVRTTVLFDPEDYELFERSVDKPGRDVFSGHGRLNVARAIELARGR